MHDMSAQAAHHGAPTSFIRKHVFSLDHKVIGKQYYALALVAVIVGMVLSWIMRIHLGWGNFAIPGLHLLSKDRRARQRDDAGVLPATDDHARHDHGLLCAHHSAFRRFRQFLSAHPGGRGGHAVSAFQHDVVLGDIRGFPGPGVVILCRRRSHPGGLDAVCAAERSGRRLRARVRVWAWFFGRASIAIFCIGQLLGSLNFITTTLDMRIKGMRLMRLPLSAWAWFITSVMGLTAFAVLMPACILLILDHVAGTSFFVPSNLVINGQMLPHSGGSTLLWQHLFWFFGHPEVYIAIVPGMGIVSHILITNMRRPMLSHRVIICCMGALAVLSYMVYGHHMFVSGMNPFSSLAFSFPTLIITIPATIVVLIWMGSLYGSKLRINTASLFALGFISMFVSGGVSGFFLAQPSIDIMLHATYFVVGHFHMVMAVAAIFGIFAGTYFWFPKMTGRMMNETLGKASFLAELRGRILHLHAIPLPGNRRERAPLPGLHRRLPASADSGAPIHHGCRSADGPCQFIFLYNLIHSRFWGKPAPDNPWEGTSLEWSTATPPPHQQFWRQDAGGLPRSLSVQRGGCELRLCDADFARTSRERARREVMSRSDDDK